MGITRFEILKKALLKLKPSLRDLCVRWSFGRCFLCKVLGFLKVVTLVPPAGCRLANLEPKD